MPWQTAAAQKLAEVAGMEGFSSQIMVQESNQGAIKIALNLG